MDFMGIEDMANAWLTNADEIIELPDGRVLVDDGLYVFEVEIDESILKTARRYHRWRDKQRSYRGKFDQAVAILDELKRCGKLAYYEATLIEDAA